MGWFVLLLTVPDLQPGHATPCPKYARPTQQAHGQHHRTSYYHALPHPHYCYSPSLAQQRQSRHFPAHYFRWSLLDALLRTQFVLLHETAAGCLIPVQVGDIGGSTEGQHQDKPEPVRVSRRFVSELSVRSPKATLRMTNLTENYQTKLVPGERYHLF